MHEFFDVILYSSIYLQVLSFLSAIFYTKFNWLKRRRRREKRKRKKLDVKNTQNFIFVSTHELHWVLLCVVQFNERVKIELNKMNFLVDSLCLTFEWQFSSFYFGDVILWEGGGSLHPSCSGLCFVSCFNCLFNCTRGSCFFVIRNSTLKTVWSVWPYLWPRNLAVGLGRWHMRSGKIGTVTLSSWISGVGVGSWKSVLMVMVMVMRFGMVYRFMMSNVMWLMVRLVVWNM